MIEGLNFFKKTTIKTISINTRLNRSQYIQKRSYFKPGINKFKYWNITKTWVFFYGNSLLSLPNFIYLSELYMTKFILNLKRIVKKSYRTLRKYWITLRVLIRIKKQSKGARMGKGKGKNIYLVQKISPFTNFVEFKGVRAGRLFMFVKFFNSRFPFQLFGILGNYSWLTDLAYYTFRRY